MNRILKNLVLIALALIATSVSIYADGTPYGAAAAEAAIVNGSSYTITDMLRWAVEDEYLAHGEYDAVLKRFGAIRPFSNITTAEEQHLSWLRAEYKTRGLAFPADGSASRIVVPSDLKAAAQAGVDAEIANIGMYQTFLSRPELARPENTSVKTLFEELMRASENHLRSFRTQLAKY